MSKETKKVTKLAVAIAKNRKPGKLKHLWHYAGGECKCERCGLYLEPNGMVGKSSSNKGRKFKDPGCIIPIIKK
jgi:hypothetical protein